jgi:hypothetical protein
MIVTTRVLREELRSTLRLEYTLKSSFFLFFPLILA